MTDTPLQAKLVRVRVVEGQAGLFYATSSDLKGLLVAEPSLDRLARALPGAITNLYAALGERVLVARVGAEGQESDHWMWVAIPEEALKLATQGTEASVS